MIISSSCLATAMFAISVGAREQGQGPTTSAGGNLPTSWSNFTALTFVLGDKTEVTYSNPQALSQFTTGIALRLLQTGAEPGELVTEDNTWGVADLRQALCKGNNIEPSCSFESNDAVKFQVGFEPGEEFDPRNLNHFFFCFGLISPPTCSLSSPLFDVAMNPVEPPSPSPNPLEGTFTIVTSTPVLSLAEAVPTIPSVNGQSTFGAPTGDISSTVTVSATPTVIGTVTLSEQTAAAVGATGPTPSGGNKLSTGAIVGIALGSLVLVALIAVLAIFFCLRSRRRHRTRLVTAGTGPEQVMLTRSLHPDNNSQDLLTEKDTAVHTLIHPNSNDSNFLLHHPNSNDSTFRQTLISNGTTTYEGNRHDSGAFGDTEVTDLPLQRHSALSAYDSAPSAPYNGPAASPPRRKPTAASSAAVSALSRNLSTSTAVSAQIPLSPHSPSSEYSDYRDADHNLTLPTHNSQLQNIGEEDSNSSSTETAPRHPEGKPRYGDTRHIPQVFPGTLQAPFLSEPGMSAEEVARLEEEERRIDAAILAADEARGRAGSGMR